MKMKIGNVAKTLLPLGAGVIGANLLTGMVKKFDKSGKLEKFAPVAPIVVGAFLSGNKKMQMVGYGMIAGGVGKLAGNLVPALAGLEDGDIDLSGVFGNLDIGAATLNDGEFDMGAATLNGPNEFEQVMGQGYDRY